MKGRVLSEVLKEFELQGYQLCIVDFKPWTIHQECLFPVLKVCYSRYCSWFADIGPVFKLNTGNLEDDVGWKSALTDWANAEDLVYWCEESTAKVGRVGVIVKEDASSLLT